MDTFDTSEEVMSDTDINATEVDFGENFEFGVNDQESENNNEQEDTIDGEKGEKNTEDEKLEKKEDPLMQCITENRGASGENSKLEIEKTISAESMRENIVNSGLSREQQTEELERLDNILANPEQAHIFPDFIKETADTKITYFAALKVDGEDNVRTLIVSVEEKKEKPEEKPIEKVDGIKVEEATLNLELSIDIDKQEEINKETVFDESLLAEIEVTNKQEVGNVEEVVQSKEDTFIVSEASQIDVKPITVQEEGIIDNVVSYEEFLNFDTILNNERVVVENIAAEKIDVDKEHIINANKEEEVNIDISKNVEEKTIKNEEKVLTLEDKIRELLGYSNEQAEKVMADVEEIENRTETHERIQTSHAEYLQEQKTEPVEQISNAEKVEVNIVEERPEEIVLVNEQESKVSNTIEQTITKEVTTDIKAEGSEHAIIEQTHIEKIDIVSDMADVSKETLVNSNQEVIKVINMSEATEKNSTIIEIKVEEGIVEKVQGSDVVIEAVVDIPQEVNKTESILSEVVNEVSVAENKDAKIESKEEQEVTVNNMQTQDIEKIEIVPSVAESNRSEIQNVVSVNIENTKEEKVDQNKESPIVIKSEEKIIFETKEKNINLNAGKVDNTKSEKVILKNIDIKTTKPVVEKTNTTKEINRLPNDKEKTSKNNREAIILRFNGNTINNTTRNEAVISLEKPKEAKRTTEESLKAKPLSGHEILLQILGISQNAMESRNAEPTNSRSVPNINQEEQETKSTKSVSSIYQQRNLNGITLKIAA